MMPKVFLFTPAAPRRLPDTVNLSTLEANEVMQGVFRLAGIWELRQALLSGNTRQNQDNLREASATLTTQIRKKWTQGKDLEFYLEYVGNDIRLTVKDIAKTVTAISERSDGFTAYFAMRMLLVLGSTIDNKPFIGGWVKVKEHLGLYLSANFLFADKSSSPRALLTRSTFPSSFKALSNMDTSMETLTGLLSVVRPTVRKLASIYIQEQRSVAVLVDGDVEGNQRKQKIETWAQRARQECSVIILSRPDGIPCSIEDFLEPTAYIGAVVAACKQAVDASHIKPEKKEWLTELRKTT